MITTTMLRASGIWKRVNGIDLVLCDVQAKLAKTAAQGNILPNGATPPRGVRHYEAGACIRLGRKADHFCCCCEASLLLTKSSGHLVVCSQVR